MKDREKSASFEEFKKFTREVVAGRRQVDPAAPKIWAEPYDIKSREGRKVQFHSLEAGVKLLSPQNRVLLRVIAKRRPNSISELAKLTGRAEPNLLRTLHKLSAAGLVLLKKDNGRTYNPVVAARKVHFEIDLLG